MAARTGEKYRTPIPKRDIEARSTGSGPVTSYYLTKEELERMKEKEGPACGLTKQGLIEAIASGETMASVERAWSMKYNTIHVWTKKWDLKGLTPDKARELLEQMTADAETEEVIGLQASEGDGKPEAQEPAIAPDVKSTDNEVAARIIAAEVELTREKDATIERLKEEYDRLEKRMVENHSQAVSNAVTIDELSDVLRQKDEKIGQLQALVEQLNPAENEQMQLLERRLAEKDGVFRDMQALIDRSLEREKKLQSSVADLKSRLLEAAARLAAYEADKPASGAPVAGDPVNHPAHYTPGKVECIDALEAATEQLTGIEAVCTANAIKYLWRWKRKNGVEDLRKAQWYLDRLIGGQDNAAKPTEA